METYLVSQVPVTCEDGLVTDSVRLANQLVQWAICVVPRQPCGFAVVGIAASLVVLLLSGVDDWDSVCHDGKGGGILRKGHVIGITEF